LLVTATGRHNVALASNGAVATASSANTCCGFWSTGAINGNNRGPWGFGEGWIDATENVVPDWIQVDFAGSKTIDEISVFSLHDNYTQENTPTETQTFSLYGLLAFNVQYWNGSSWVTIPGGSVTGNNKVWRKFSFSAITTSKIRVSINSVPDSWSRVVEIQAFGTSAGGEKVRWLVPDHLGTPRMVVDETGSLAGVRRHDYLPFGGELFAGTGGRTVALGYAGDGVRQQFTSYERDTESGLDFAEARYYSSSQGRFTSVDPLMASASTANPQTFNRYSYVTNSPLTQIDPSGMFGISPGGSQFGAIGSPLIFSLNGQTDQQAQQPAPGLPPPPGGPVTVGPITIDVGPIPLPEGQVAWPTTLEIVENPNQTYNGQQLTSPSGIVIDHLPNYGVGRTVDYIIRDQVGNPISGDAAITEKVTADNAHAQALMESTDIQGQLIRTDQNGIVPDTLGPVTQRPASLTFIQQNPHVNATFKQTLTVYGTFGREFRKAITLESTYTLTKSGVTIARGTPVYSPRPLK
jgi:RHS repeat-associated protein